MTTDPPSGAPPSSPTKTETSPPRSDLGPPRSETSPPARSSDLDLVRQTLPAIAPALAQRPELMKLASGRSISVVEVAGEERVEIRAATGEVMIAMRLTDEGPVFSLSGASLEISATKRLSLSGETVHVSASKQLSLEAGELARTKARDVEIEAAPGAISLRANDDVDIVGERVRLNSEDPPMPHSWEELRARRATQGHPFSDDMPLSPMRPQAASTSFDPASAPEPSENGGAD